MIKHIRLSLVLFVVLFANMAIADHHRLFEAQYEASYQGWSLASTRTLTYVGENRYLLESVVNGTLVSITERSEFRLGRNGELIPDHYTYQQKVFGVKRQRSLAFDYDKQQVVARYKGKEKVLPLSQRVSDPVLYQLQMQRDLYGGDLAKEYTFVRKGKFKRYQFDQKPAKPVAGQPNTQAPIIRTTAWGEQSVVQLERLSSDGERRTTISMLPEEDFHMVSIDFVDSSSDSYQLNLVKLDVSDDFERLFLNVKE